MIQILELETATDRINNETVQTFVGDIKREIEVRVLSNHNPVDLSSWTLEMRATAPNGAIIATGEGIERTDNANGRLTIKLPAAVTSLSGVIRDMRIRMTQESASSVLSTEQFVISVLPTPGFEEKFPQAVDAIQQAIDSLVDATNAALAGEAKINAFDADAKAALQKAQDNLDAANKLVADAADVANTAAKTANDASGTANKATTDANKATENANDATIKANTAAANADVAAGKATVSAGAADTATVQANTAATSANTAATNAQAMADDIKNNPDKYRGPAGEKGDPGIQGPKGDPGSINNLDETVAKAVAPIDDRVTDVETKQKSQQATLDGMSTTIANEVKPAKELAESLDSRMTAVETSDATKVTETQVKAIIDEQPVRGATWYGSLSAYQALGTYDQDTDYYILADFEVLI